MDDEVVLKTTKNCTFRMRPGTMTLTDRRVLFTSWPGKKVMVEVPLDSISGVKPFRLGAVHIDTNDGGFVRIQVNAVTAGAWVEAIRQARPGLAH